MELLKQLNQPAFAEFEAHRKEIKKKLTPTATKKQIAFLCRYDLPTQQRIIDETIRNSWTGLFEPRGDYGQHKQSATEKRAATAYGINTTDF